MLKSLRLQFRALWENRFFDNAAQIFFDRLLGRDTGLTVYRKGPLRILIDHRGEDQYGTRVCLLDGVYAALLDRAPPPAAPSVIDLGANGGGFPLLLALRGTPPGHLCAVEMNPHTYERLAFNVRTNGFPDAVLLNAAVAGAPGEVSRAWGLGSVSESTSTPAGADSPVPRTRAVPLLTFDDIAEQSGLAGGEIDLVKMDVEGAEYDVILGEAATALARCRRLLVEFHDDARTPAAKARLGSLGFRERGSFRQQYESCLLVRED